ncbi:NAD(P)/FAD-dependent oxidoreductase [Pseudonocardia asaccharolytica]|uniref:Oxidoreductase n=1 Tax=Pseudonocardia asaccharolytica DSM 44247 = NBRC 16224 TaxID=1123024 RepID=A0A511CXF5_9PSEU|nr:FAD-dependent oxidoreductase [Pseudonocardia asaccharolytica]GEL17231.1 oxidoreductase [Pseudonocardia asaccharolytica DSM 44247 = NBRC 16224]
MSTERGTVVVGAGHAGTQVAFSLREAGYRKPVVVIDSEPDLPYQKPPLSKTFLSGDQSISQIVFRPREFYSSQGITLLAGRQADGIDRKSRTVLLAGGTGVPYEHLVLAVGCTPKRPDIEGAGLDGVLTLRSLRDARRLRSSLLTASRVVIVGGGFLGLEIAAAARTLGKHVSVIEVQDRLLERAVSAPVAAHVAGVHADRGVNVRCGVQVGRIVDDGSGRVAAVETTDGSVVPADLVVVGIGVSPNEELATTAGLDVAGGIVVDSELSTKDPCISAVGDCARFPSPDGAGSVRIESVQNALDQARSVAKKIVGRPAPYHAMPWFWSEQFGTKVQMVGLTGGCDNVRLTGSVDEGKFSAFCFRDGLLRGVESVNSPRDHIVARKTMSVTRLLSLDQLDRAGFDLRDLGGIPR